MLHHCIEGERVGDDGSKIVDVDRRPDRCPGGTPAPPEARGREPPSGPWSPWRRRGGSPSEIGPPSLFSSVSCSPHLALHGFLNSWRSVTPIALKF